METNIKRHFESELIIQRKNLELLNLLESRCEGLENLLCKNVINLISKKIDSIEKRVTEEEEIRHAKQIFPVKQSPPKNKEEEKISKLNNNLDIIEYSFKAGVSNGNTVASDIISKKIEENYKLLDELERTNRPIFSKTTEINSKIFIEDKLKEMDDKLNVIFSEYKEKNSRIKNNEDLTRKTNNENQNVIYAQSLPFERNIKSVTEIQTPVKENKISEAEARKKELLSKLSETEKKIKSIAGKILKNF